MKKRYAFFSQTWIHCSLFIAAFFFFSLTLQAQIAPVKHWDKTFGGAAVDQLNSLQQTSDGGYILGGWSKSGIGSDKTQASKGFSDYWIVKLDANGSKTWDKTFGGSSDDALTSLQQTSGGGYILGGGSNSGISGDKTQAGKGGDDYWVVKLDASGNKTWDKTFGGSSDDVLTSLQQTSDGGYILGGWSRSPISGDKSQACQGYTDFWVVKLDASGNKTWDKTFGGIGFDDLRSLQQTSDGGYILGGKSESGVSGDKSQPRQGADDYWVIKLDASGNKTWDKTFGGNSLDDLHSLQQTSDGGYILGGLSWSGISGDKSQASKGSADYWVVKLDASGNKTWDRTFGGNGYDKFFSLQQTSDGGYILGGQSTSNISGDKTQAPVGIYGLDDYWVVKLDASGNKIWDKTLGGNDNDDLHSLQQTSDGGYILGGSSTSWISGDKSQDNNGSVDYWVIKLIDPCKLLTATLTTSCNNGSTSVDLNVIGIQSGTWTLTYTVNGVIQTATGTTPTFTLAQNATLGSVYSLASIVSGTCTTILTNSLTIQPIPASPAITSGSNLCAGFVKLSATGAPTGGSYVWYDVATGGTPLYNSPSGTFTTPKINTTTIYYVAASTEAGCEGPRTPVIATITTCPPTFIPNIITLNHDGKNDIFKPQNLPEGRWQLQIYNRWGVKLFEAEDYQNNWPDKKISDGTYYYLLRNPETGQHYKGWVEVAQ